MRLGEKKLQAISVLRSLGGRPANEENYAKIWLLRAVLHPQTELMDELLKLTAAVWDKRQMAEQDQGGESQT